MQQGNAATAAPAEKAVNPDRTQYLTHINSLMLERAGVRYVEVMESLHSGRESFVDAFDRGVAETDFVARTMHDFGFVKVEHHGMDKAAGYNKAKAAMAEFAVSSSDWVRGRDGTLFMQTDNGVAVMRPVMHRETRRFGFGIEMREGARLDTHATHLVEDGQVTERFAGFDIDQALAGMKASFDAKSGFSF